MRSESVLADGILVAPGVSPGSRSTQRFKPARLVERLLFKILRSEGAIGS